MPLRDLAKAVQDMVTSYNGLLSEYIRRDSKAGINPDLVPTPESFRYAKEVYNFLSNLEKQ